MRSVLDEIIGPEMAWESASLRRTQYDPSASQSVALLGCFCGRILSPSRRQIRVTRLWFTCQPASPSIAVTRRDM